MNTQYITFFKTTTMNIYCQRFFILAISVLILSCNKDSIPVSDLQRLPDSFTVSFTDEDIRPISNDEVLFNGEIIRYRITSNLDTPGVPELFEIKNVSNPKVKVALTERFSDRIAFITDEATDQEVSFEVYYDNKKLDTFKALVQIPLKIQKNGVDIIGDLNLDFTDKLSQEYTLVAREGLELKTFNRDNIRFENESGAYLQNYEIFKGDNFRILFEASEEMGNEFSAKMYYRGEEFDYKSIYIKTMNIKTADLYKDCSIIKERFVVSNSVGNSVDRDFELLIQDGFITEFSDQSGEGRVNKVFYENGKIIEVISTKNGIAKANYTYENELLKNTELTLSSNYRDIYDYYYNNNETLSAKTYKSYNRRSGTLIKKDSTLYENYVNNNPERKIEYLDLQDVNNTYTLYKKMQYDVSGNRIKEEVSKDDINYVLSVEERFDATEKVTEHFIWETGEIFKTTPVSFSKTFYANRRGDVISPSILSLTEIKKDDNGRIIAIDKKYFDDDIAGGEADFFLTFAYETCIE